MAMEYEDEYTKNQILNQYLNTASYGTNNGKTAVGVEAASQVYFDKDVSDLNVGEAALLAGLPQAPTDYNPFINPKGAKQRRNEVLAAMRDQGYISPATYAKVANAGLGLHRGFHYEQRSQQYFFDFVQQELIDKYGVATAREGGLKVYTTLDPQPAGGRRAGDRRAPGEPGPPRRWSRPRSTPARSRRWPPRRPTT